MLEALLKTSRTNAFQNFVIGEVIELCQEDIDYADGTSESVFSGELIVKLPSSATVKCPYLTNSGGQSQMSMSIPETGSIALLVNIGDTPDEKVYIALGFLPLPLNLMIARRKESEGLYAGEHVMQASSSSGDDWWKGARTKWDKYGRFTITSGDESFKIIVGDLLSNEYTSDVTVVKDEITGQAVVYSEQFKKYGRNIDRAGNCIERWRDILVDCDANKMQTIRGRYIIATGGDIKLSRGTAQFIEFNSKGVTLRSLNIALVSQGAVDISATTAMSLFSFLDMAILSGGSLAIKATTELLLACQAIKIKAQTTASIDALVSVDINSAIAGVTGEAVAGLYSTGLVQLLSKTGTQSVFRAEATAAYLDAGVWTDSFGLPVVLTTKLTPAILALANVQIKIP